MNILAPAINLESGKAVIDAGAKEIYISGDEGLFTNFSFSGRGKVSSNNKNNCCTYDELRELVSYAHENNAKVNYLGNVPFFYNRQAKDGKDTEKYFLNYVEKGIDAGIDSIVIGDIGLLHVLYKKNYHVDIHSSVYFNTINIEQIKFFKELNVSRVTLSYHIKMDEIIKILQVTDMQIEVIGHLGCSFFNGACNFLHDLGECSSDSFNIGITCKGVYSANLNGNKITTRIFDKEKICSLCKIHELSKLGVQALKIVGRDRDYKTNLEIIKIYSDYLKKEEDKEALIERLPKWWIRKFCQSNRCKFL